MLPNHDPVFQALLASLFTWGVTALGAALVFVLPSNSKKFLDVSLGFAAGVMTAASFWSLLAPAIEISEARMGSWAFIPVAVGFALGAVFVHLSDLFIPSCVVAEMSLIHVLTKDCDPMSSPFDTNNEENSRGLNSSAYIRDQDQCPLNRLPITPTGVNDHGNCTGSSSSGALPPSVLSTNSTDRHARYSYQAPPPDVSELRHRLPASRATAAVATRREKGAMNASNNDAIDVQIPVEDNPRYSERLVSWRRILLLIMAVTVHNIPEGMAVGIGFGSVGKTPAATFEKAVNLAIGIGLQNFPEGLAVSLPLAGFGYSKVKAFLYGQLSGAVEPIAALLGAAAVLLMEPVLPYALSFAAGAMIYVVFDDIVPEAQCNGNKKLASAGAIVGFLVMMCMDVGLG